MIVNHPLTRSGPMARLASAYQCWVAEARTRTVLVYRVMPQSWTESETAPAAGPVYSVCRNRGCHSASMTDRLSTRMAADT